MAKRSRTGRLLPRRGPFYKNGSTITGAAILRKFRLINYYIVSYTTNYNKPLNDMWNHFPI